MEGEGLLNRTKGNGWKYQNSAPVETMAKKKAKSPCSRLKGVFFRGKRGEYTHIPDHTSCLDYTMKFQLDSSSKGSTTATIVEEQDPVKSTNSGTTGVTLRRPEEGKSSETKDLLREKYLAERRKLGASETFTLLSFNEAPSHLQFNPFIRTGYRGYLSTKMCLESIFWWTNETINIWSHIFGWMLFLGLTLYDLLLLNIHASLTDKFIVGMLLVCFQVCMIFSSLYHTFSCRSEKDYWSFLTYDLLGISLSLLAIYLSGIYYAFWCHKLWQNFYLSTVLIIFLLAMILQWPRLNISSNLKLLVFVAWAAYGVVPTFHWTIIMGGVDNPVVQLLLPRVLGMYAISGLAFLIYITKVPERFFSGKVDYIGSSHQWWHFFVVLALYYWHNTGIKYVEYRMNHGCSTNLTF